MIVAEPFPDGAGKQAMCCIAALVQWTNMGIFNG